MKTTVVALATALAVLPAAEALAQQSALERLPREVLDVIAPSGRVSGAPGQMSIASRACREITGIPLRRRIVDIAAQEWAFFGFPVLDRISGDRILPPGAAQRPASPLPGAPGPARRAPQMSPAEAGRVAASIAGYWTATPEGSWVIADQNRAWTGAGGIGARWVAPWSAAFISWVMCEAGLGTEDRFRRAVAHHVYIDQAIRARDGAAPRSAFVAYEIGEEGVEPGDLLCTSSRPRYRTLAERRRQLGAGARSHCDIVVTVDPGAERIYAIGGNVLRSVSLKVLPGERRPDGTVRARATGGVPLFAHLKLRETPIEPNALLRSPTFEALGCPASPRPGERGAYVMGVVGLAGLPRECGPGE
jgi:hypothetical protein